MVSVGDTLYRAQDSHLASGPAFDMRRYEVMRVTPCGAWIKQFFYNGSISPRIYCEEERWISTRSRFRFAHHTTDEAIESYRFRKRKQIKILRDQLESAIKSLRAAGGQLPASPLLRETP